MKNKQYQWFKTYVLGYFSQYYVRRDRQIRVSRVSYHIDQKTTRLKLTVLLLQRYSKRGRRFHVISPLEPTCSSA
jgi:hypothetical protein